MRNVLGIPEMSWVSLAVIGSVLRPNAAASNICDARASGREIQLGL
jgi:hypothetical protein